MRAPSRRSAALLALAAALILAASPAAAQAVEWIARDNGGFVDDVEACPGSNASGRHAIAVDGAGNVYVTGRSASGPFSPPTVFRTVKYGPDGTRLWNVASSEHGTASAVTADAAGNAYVTGTVGGDIRTFKYAASDGHVMWSAAYDGPAHGADGPVMIAVDGAGNVLVTGGSSNGTDGDFVTIKHAASDGHIVWSARYSGGSGDDRPAGLAVDGLGNVYVTGTAQNGNVTDFRTIKYAGADGSVLWSQPYVGPGNGTDVPTAIAVDAAGNAFVTGSSQAGYFDPYGNFRTVKYAAADGAVLWDVAFDGPAQLDDVAYAVAVDTAGNAYITGISDAGDTQGGDFRTIKYAATDGAALWSVAYDGPAHLGDSAWAISLDPAGDALVTGVSYDSANSPAYRTVKHDASDGAVRWIATYGGAGHPYDFALAQAVDIGGNALVTGYAWNGTNGDFRTVKYASADGAQQFSVTDGSVSGLLDRPSRHTGLAVDASGNVAVSGTVGGGQTVCRTVKHGSAGQALWSASFDDPHGDAGNRCVVAVDNQGNVVTAGSLWNGTDLDFRTVKQAADDGTVLWDVTLDGPAAASDETVADVALDAAGNVYVAGTTGPAMEQDYLLVKYAAGDGSRLWTAGLTTAGPYDGVAGLALDAAGNAYVAAWYMNGTNDDFRVLKYSPDGALLWSAGHGTAARDFPVALALDPLGNVLVTGTSGAAPVFDVLTVKFAASDGAVLWSATYASPEGLSDAAGGIAVDAAGDAFVASYAEGGQAFRTIKYRSADGLALWVASYDDPLRLEGETAGIVLDASGNPVIAGTSYSAMTYDGEKADYLTLSYAADDGSLQWQARYDAGQRDMPAVVRAKGDAVYVAGTSYAQATDLDFLTIKYVADSVAPLPPSSLSSSTHAPGVWSSHPQVVMSWSGAVDPPPASGLLGYSVPTTRARGRCRTRPWTCRSPRTRTGRPARRCPRGRATTSTCARATTGATARRRCTRGRTGSTRRRRWRRPA